MDLIMRARSSAEPGFVLDLLTLPYAIASADGQATASAQGF